MKLYYLIAILCCMLFIGGGKVYGEVHSGQPAIQQVERAALGNNIFGTAVDFFDEAIVPSQLVSEGQSTFFRRSIVFIKAFINTCAVANAPLCQPSAYFNHWQHSLQQASQPLYLSIRTLRI